MFIHPKLAVFNETLEKLFHEVDEALEERWGGCFPLHPNRPEKGDTCNPEMDGLFEIAPDFTPGLTSRKGRGYIVSLRVATLDKVHPEQYALFMEEAARLIGEKLPVYFPGRDLAVVRDSGRPGQAACCKIIGDFSLGEV